MPGGEIVIHTLGRIGVMIDPEPLSSDTTNEYGTAIPALPDAALRNSQNMSHDPNNQHAGALRKRAGLGRFLSTQLAGPILGGVPAPVAGTGGAPQNVSGSAGAPGDTGGTSPSTNPSGTIDGAGTGSAGADLPSPSGATNPGAFPGGGAGNAGLFGGARIVVVARATGAGPGNQKGQGWYVSSERLQNPAVIRTGTPGPAGVQDDQQLAGLLILGSSAVVISGVLYYALAIDDQANPSVSMVVRKTDGFTDSFVCQLPLNPNIRNADKSLNKLQHAIILSMGVASGNIYVGVRDVNYNGSDTLNNDIGRIFQIVPATGLTVNPVLPATINSIPTSIPATLPSGLSTANIMSPPMALAGHNGQAWVGTSFSNGSQRAAIVYPVQASESVALELILTRPYREVSAMCSYAGKLYVGFHMLSSSGHAITSGHIYAMSSAWASGGSPWADTLTLTDNGAGDDNYVPSMVVFNGLLYISYYNPGDVSRVYSYDGTTLTKVFDAAGSQKQPLFLFTDNVSLYAVGTNNNPVGAVKVYLYTDDGVTWVDRTTTMADGVSSAWCLPVLFGYNQQ